MKVAGSAEEFAADRFGRYFAGKHFLVWSADDTIGGGVVWGAPDEDDAIELERALAFDLDRAKDAPFDVLLDASRLRTVSRAVFESFLRASPRLLRWIPLLRRRAIVPPPRGIASALVHGTGAVIGWENGRTFASSREALEWLERPELALEIESITGAAVQARPAMSLLRDWLGDHLQDATLEHAARAFGRSVRAMQRELGAGGTSFRAELERARVDRARALLRDTDTKMAAIATEIGCRSPSAFAALFGRVTGEAPSAFRARHR